MYSIKKGQVLAARLVNRLLLSFKGIQLVDGHGVFELVVQLAGVFYKHLLLLAVVLQDLPLAIDRLDQLFLLFPLLRYQLLVLEVDKLDVLNQVHFTFDLELDLRLEGGQVTSLLVQLGYAPFEMVSLLVALPDLGLLQILHLLELTDLILNLAPLVY